MTAQSKVVPIRKRKPNILNGKVSPPRRVRNADRRSREHLTPWRDYAGPYVFTTERGGPMTTSAVRKIVARAGELAKLPFPTHPHMLRHACGYKLANDGHDTRSVQHYLGHKNIQHTVRYTDMAPGRFKDFWRD